MKEYLKISLIISTFGLLKETRPSEPYITDFIVDFKNITVEQINQDIFPIGKNFPWPDLPPDFLINRHLFISRSAGDNFPCHRLVAIQAPYYRARCIWRHNMESTALDELGIERTDCGGHLWDLLRHWDRILQLHLCENWQETLSSCDVTHTSGDFHWSICRCSLGSVSGDVWDYELSTTQLLDGIWWVYFW